MKYVIALALCFILASCADEKTLSDGKTYQPYGWADYQDIKSDKVVYKVSKGNVAWSIIASETVVIPAWLTGWQLFEPVRLKSDSVNVK